ncbi:hypothetical protein BJ170DRAFT_235843 [Xylariales sp. AK1849]|nr:hypothetical protein BJ170DRAFT_235843 [Xylariales sp. AK1849]
MESADHRQQEQPQDTGISTQPSSENPDGNPKVLEPGPAVRFASKVEEFGPNGGPSKVEPTKDAVASPPDKPTELSQEQIKELSTTLQEQRVQNSYSFQPFSLPASRVCGLPCLVFLNIA